MHPSSSSIRFRSSTLLVALGIVFQLGCINAFISSSSLILPTSISSSKITSPAWVLVDTTTATATTDSGGVALRMSSDREEEAKFKSDDNSRSSIRDLGFSDAEIERSARKPQKERTKVRVDMVDNVDATTLTAVGFGLIAFNFFVLANMGDGGIGGVVAYIINSL